MNHEYKVLDEAILTYVASHGPIQFGTLVLMPDVKNESYRLSAAQQTATKGRSIKEPFRFVDARLQALRKRGLVEPAPLKLGWRMIQKKESK